MTSNILKHTPLFAAHTALGARMVPFGGWEMPVQYSGLVDEHHSVRTAAGVFDISHMGEFIVRGPQALAYLQHLLTADIAAIRVGEANYALLCNNAGGVIDDTFVYHLPDEYLVVVNAANIDKDFAWMATHLPGFDVEITNTSDRTAMLALQGPAAEALLRPLAGDLAELPFHGVATGSVGGIAATVARTGYTGEDGFEIFVHNDDSTALWDAVLAAGARPCGLGARDSLRFEPCLALYGHELTEDVNPYEARLGWVVKLEKGDFVGRDALQQIKAAGVARRLTGFTMTGRGIARGEYPIHSIDGVPIGVVTSGMPAPTVGQHVGMGFVPTAHSAEGSEFDVIVRERPVRARATRMPFYKPRYKKP